VGQEAVGQLEKSQLGAVISERVTSGVDSTRQKLELINPKLQQQREDARVSAMGEFTAEMAEKIAQLEDATHELRAELGEALAREESLKRSLAQRHVHGVAPGSDERPAAAGAGAGSGVREPEPEPQQPSSELLDLLGLSEPGTGASAATAAAAAAAATPALPASTALIDALEDDFFSSAAPPLAEDGWVRERERERERERARRTAVSGLCAVAACVFVCGCCGCQKKTLGAAVMTAARMISRMIARALCLRREG
jgi:hypothetical protein